MEAKDLVRKYIEDVWNNGNLVSLAELTTEDFVYRLGGQPPRDVREMEQFLLSIRVAFPDWKVVADKIVGDDEAVAVRWSGAVTHLGPFHGAEATGKTIQVSGINFYRLENGKIAEEWEQTDSLGMLQQLGMLPT